MSDKELPMCSNNPTGETSNVAVDFYRQQPKYEGDKNFETFALVWCAETVDKSVDNLEIQIELRATVNFLRVFNDSVSCEQWLKQRRIDCGEKIILIVSCKFGRELISKVHDLSQLVSIYIFCMDAQGNEHLSQEFQKVRNYSNHCR